MIKNDQFTFKELPPPLISKVLTVSHPEQELIYEHWRHLMAAIEIETTTEDGNPQRNTYLLYKCKYHIAFMNFQEGCLLYQRKFKIVHGQSHEITSIKLHLITIKMENIKKKELLVAIGFFDGSCELHNLVVTEKSVILKKLLFLQNTGISEPVTSMVFSRKNLYLCRLHCVALYRDLLTATANIIIQDELSKAKSKETIYKFNVETLPLEGMTFGTTLTVTPGTNSIYVFNQTEGAKAIDYQTHVVNGSIIDSLVCVKETYGQNLVLGDSSNFLKVIYYSKNYVQRFTGFKNYCCAIEQVLFPSHEELWVGDGNGLLTYFQRCTAPDTSKPNANIRMVEFTVKYSVRLCQNGIKEMRVIRKLMFVMDSESNIHIFDIIRKDALQHMKTVEVQSVQEYASNEH